MSAPRALWTLLLAALIPPVPAAAEGYHRADSFAFSLLGGFDWASKTLTTPGSSATEDWTGYGGIGGVGLGYQLGNLLRLDLEVLGATATARTEAGVDRELTRLHARVIAQLVLASSNAPVGVRLGAGGDFGRLFASGGVEGRELLGFLGRVGVSVALPHHVDLGVDADLGLTEPLGFTGSVMLRVEWRLSIGG